MAHFARLGIGNIVERVEVVSNDIATSEQSGIAFLQELYNDPYGVWKQSSYNTVGNIHGLDGTPFRKNHAGVGFHYDAKRDAFISWRPFNSWILNEDTCTWKPPVAHPVGQETIYCDWDEELYKSDNTKGWVNAAGESP